MLLSTTSGVITITVDQNCCMCHCRPHKKPKMRVQMMENLSRVFSVLEAQEIKVVNVGMLHNLYVMYLVTLDTF